MQQTENSLVKIFSLATATVLAGVGIVVLVGTGLVAQRTTGLQGSSPVSRPNATESLAVRVVIDFNDGMQKVFYGVPWRNGMTAFDALVLASERQRGITMEFRGRGETAFITKIDELGNESAADGDSWLFSINEQHASQGAGVTYVSPGDTILWSYGQLP